MDTLYFKVADVCFAIHAAHADEVKALLPSYAPFYLKECSEPIILNAELMADAVSSEPEGKELGQFDCGGTNHGIYQMADGYKILISDAEGRLASAMLTKGDFSSCRISLFGDAATRQFGMGNAMMIAFAFAAASYQILLMHASVVMYEGKAYLFLGKSGTGKSTHSGLWLKHIPQTDLLNDDNPAVRIKADGEVWVYGTPWSGKTPCYRNLSLPAGAFVRLEQHKENVIAREAKLEAYASILSSCSTMMWDKYTYPAITQTVAGVISAVPAYYLKCLPDEAAARLCCQTVAGS